MKTPKEKELHSIKVQVTKKIREFQNILQRVETLEKLASEKTGVEADKKTLAVLKFSQRRGYKTL